MLTVFFDSCGVVLVKVPAWRCIMSAHQKAKTLRRNIACKSTPPSRRCATKRWDLCATENWQLQHDNASAHSSHLIQSVPLADENDKKGFGLSHERTLCLTRRSNCAPFPFKSSSNASTMEGAIGEVLAPPRTVLWRGLEFHTYRWVIYIYITRANSLWTSLVVTRTILSVFDVIFKKSEETKSAVRISLICFARNRLQWKHTDFP